MKNDRSPSPPARAGYPWWRALLVLLFYGGFLLFLWFFPLEAPRAFFQGLLRQLLYFVTGAGLILGTFLFFILFFPIPASSPEGEGAVSPDDGLDIYREGLGWGGIMMSRSVIVPSAVGDHPEAPDVWELLELLLEELPESVSIAIDGETGIVSVAGDDEMELLTAARALQDRLRRAGVNLRRPR